MKETSQSKSSLYSRVSRSENVRDQASPQNFFVKPVRQNLAKFKSANFVSKMSSHRGKSTNRRTNHHVKTPTLQEVRGGRLRFNHKRLGRRSRRLTRALYLTRQVKSAYRNRFNTKLRNQRWSSRIAQKFALRIKPERRFDKPPERSDLQVQTVWKDGKQVRCITKIGGRKIYRPLKPKFPK